LAALALACSLQAAAAPFAYVPNEKSGSVSIVDTQDERVAGEIRTGGKPRGIAASPDGATLYISEQESGALQVIDLARRDVRGRIALGPSPEGIALSRDGRWLAAAIEEENAVVLVDLAQGKVAARIRVEGRNPEHTAFSPDG